MNQNTSGKIKPIGQQVWAHIKSMRLFIRYPRVKLPRPPVVPYREDSYSDLDYHPRHPDN